MLIGEVLICEIWSVDGLATSAVSSSEISTLSHEIRNDSVERAALEMKWLTASAITLLSGAKLTEVFRSYGCVFHKVDRDSTCCLTTDSDVEEYSRVYHACLDFFLFKE